MLSDISRTRTGAPGGRGAGRHDSARLEKAARPATGARGRLRCGLRLLRLPSWLRLRGRLEGRPLRRGGCLMRKFLVLLVLLVLLIFLRWVLLRWVLLRWVLLRWVLLVRVAVGLLLHGGVALVAEEVC